MSGPRSSHAALLACAVFLCVVPDVARAQARPALVPGRDVDVLYRIASGARSMEERWRFRAADQTARLDVGAGAYMLSDLRARTATMVSPGQRSSMQMSMPPAGPGGLDGKNFRQLGALTVAGVPCTEWQTSDVAGRDVVACLTADGVLLRARHGERVLVEAVSVRYEPQNQADFTVPAGYQRLPPG